jgi:hypothetical protein
MPNVDNGFIANGLDNIDKRGKNVFTINPDFISAPLEEAIPHYRG